MGLQSESLRKFKYVKKTKPAAAKFTLFNSGKFKRLVTVNYKLESYLSFSALNAINLPPLV